MFNTSFTTAVAFMATAISPIVPISAFGIFAAIAIVVNYIFVLTLLPMTVLLWHRIFYKRSFCEGCRIIFALACGGCFPAAKPEEGGAATAPSVELTDTSMQAAGEKGKAEKDARGRSGSAVAEEAYTYSCDERFYVEWYTPAMLTTCTVCGRKVKVVALAISVSTLVYIGLSLSWAIELTPPTQQEAWFAPDHMFTGFLDAWQKDFMLGAGNEYVTMSLALGVEGIDRSDFEKWQPNDNRGDAVWDSNFDLAPAASQQTVLDACAGAVALPCAPEACGNFEKLVRPGSTYRGFALTCFLDEFQEWHAGEYNATLNSTLALGDSNPTEFYARLKTFRATTKPRARASGPRSWDEVLGFVGGNLRFVTIEFTSSLLVMQSVGIKQPTKVIIDNFVDKYNAAAPSAASGMLTDAGRDWPWMATENGLIDGMPTLVPDNSHPATIQSIIRM